MKRIPPGRGVVAQDYARYTRDDHWVWARLWRAFAAFHAANQTRLYAPYLRAFRALRLPPRRIPRLEEIDARLLPIGWRAVFIEGYLAPGDYAALGQAKILPIARALRRKEQLAYAPVPDMIHDVFGHLPLLMDPAYREFLAGWDAAACRLPAKSARRLSFWAIEFGLLGTPERHRVIGAGLLSSIAECERVFNGKTPVRAFGAEAARTEFKLSDFQNQLFACPSLALYKETVAACARRPS